MDNCCYSTSAPEGILAQGTNFTSKGGMVMKRILVLLTLLVFVATVTAVFAVDPSQSKQVAPQINCCLPDGQCLKTRADNCALKQGIQVSDCKTCPGVWGKGKKK
jgi:hypothetical protein